MPSTDSSYLLTTLADLARWGQSHSFRPFAMTTACCATEYKAASASRYDMARLGAEMNSCAPEQADVLLVLGTVTCKQAPLLRHVYEQMNTPKWVIAVGACASSGGFYKNYHTLQGIDGLLPVDLYVPGCPPRPEAILEAVTHLQEAIREQTWQDPALSPPHQRPDRDRLQQRTLEEADRSLQERAQRDTEESMQNNEADKASLSREDAES